MKINDFTFNFAEDDEGIYCNINILDKDGDPVYGSTGESETTKSEAVVSAIQCMLEGWGPDAHDDIRGALKAAYEGRILERFELLKWYSMEAFVYEGVVYFVEPSMESPFFEICDSDFNKKTAFDLSAYDMWRLNALIKDAKKEGEATAEGYDAWEASWINGPQW